MFLRLFRAPDLAFWTLAVIVLGVLLAVAAAVGSNERLTAWVPGANPVPGVTRSDATEAARNVVALMQAGTAAGTDPAALTAWAAALREHTATGTTTRLNEGAEPGDDLLAEFAAIDALAASLTDVATDPVAASGYRTQIGLHANRLHALVTGLPAPQVPSGSLNPHPGQDLTPPVPGTVTAPPAPTAPQPSVPAPATPSTTTLVELIP